MLARIAEALYWTARDIERAVAVTRTVEIGHACSLEGPSQNGAGRTHVWEPVVRIAGDWDEFIARHRRADERSVPWYLALSETNPDSVVACLSRARQRLRAIRSRLPSELFEMVAAGDILGQEWSSQRLAREGLFSFCHQVRGHVAIVDGIVDRAVRRDEYWQFLRIGRHLERAMQITRTVAVHAALVEMGDARLPGLGDWRTLLKLGSSYEAYLRVALSEGADPGPMAFLLGDPAAPSSVTYCLTELAGGLDTVETGHPGLTGAAARAVETGLEIAVKAPVLRQDLVALGTALDDVHDGVCALFLPTMEFADGPIHAQAVRQAQN